MDARPGQFQNRKETGGNINLVPTKNIKNLMCRKEIKREADTTKSLTFRIHQRQAGFLAMDEKRKTRKSCDK